MNTHLVRRPVRRPLPSLFGSTFDFDSLDRLFGDFPARAARPQFAPAIDVENTDGEIRLVAELPGLEEKDFEVLVEDDVLTLKGEKRSEQTSEEQKGLWRVERSHGSFERRFRLGWEVDPDSVEASYRNGVLQIVVPKPEPERSAVRQIPVSSNPS